MGATGDELLTLAANALRSAIGYIEQFETMAVALGAPAVGRPSEPIGDAGVELRNAISPDLPAEDWKLIAENRLQTRLNIRRKPAALLLYLMESPGVLVPTDNIKSALSVKASSPKVIQVYICHLRSAFRRLGLDDDLIMTGYGCYGIRGLGKDTILRMITDLAV